MKLLEVANTMLKPDIQKKADKIEKAVKKEMLRYGKCKVSWKPQDEVKATIYVDFERFMHEEDINGAYEEFKDAINKADTDGHIFKLTDEGHGAQFVNALLTGLRPGMTVKAEAFFPTLGYEITWKNIVSRKG